MAQPLINSGDSSDAHGSRLETLHTCCTESIMSAFWVGIGNHSLKLMTSVAATCHFKINWFKYILFNAPLHYCLIDIQQIYIDLQSRELSFRVWLHEIGWPGWSSLSRWVWARVYKQRACPVPACTASPVSGHLLLRSLGTPIVSVTSPRSLWELMKGASRPGTRERALAPS